MLVIIVDKVCHIRVYVFKYVFCTHGISFFALFELSKKIENGVLRMLFLTNCATSYASINLVAVFTVARLSGTHSDLIQILIPLN